MDCSELVPPPLVVGKAEDSWSGGGAIEDTRGRPVGHFRRDAWVNASDLGGIDAQSPGA